MNLTHTRRQVSTNIKKEVWEFQKTLVWMPIIIVALLVIVATLELLSLQDYQSAAIYRGFEYLQNRDDFNGLSNLVLIIMQAIMMPFMLIALFIQVHFCLSCLYDDRKDLSVYFWRSLPVSDVQSVGVKLFVGLLVIPFIFLLAGTLLQLLIGLGIIIISSVLSIAYDISLWHVVSQLDIFTNLFKIWWTVIPYSLWLFPIFAWLMLASAIAKRSPFLIAVLPVVAIIFTEVLLNKLLGFGSLYVTDLVLNYLSLRVELNVGGSDSSHSIQSLANINDSKLPFYLADIFTNKISIIATLLGGLFIYLALWLRKNRAQ